jgi:hypothetical protein
MSIDYGLPVVDFVANLVNSIGNISESMPGPVSDRLTATSLLFGTLAGVILILPDSAQDPLYLFSLQGHQDQHPVLLLHNDLLPNF